MSCISLPENYDIFTDSGYVYFNELELSFIHEILYEVKRGIHLNNLIIKLDSIKLEYTSEFTDQDRIDILNIGVSIAKSSGGRDMFCINEPIRDEFLKLNPVRENNNSSRNENGPELCNCCKVLCPPQFCACADDGGLGGGDGGCSGPSTGGFDWGEWFAWTATSDITAGLTAASISSYNAAIVSAATGGVAAPGAGLTVLGISLTSSGVASTIAGIGGLRDYP
jgi:hypothetical protein